MADTFILSGTYSTNPTQGNPSAVPSLSAPIDERLQLDNKTVQYFDLTSDAPVAVQFPSGFAANLLIVKTEGGKVRVRITSSDGTTQAIPVDKFLVLFTESVDITAVDLTRELGVEVLVNVFMGDQAL